MAGVSLRFAARISVAQPLEDAVGEIETLSMPLEEAMRTQRAIRRLKTDPVDDALVRRLIELAMKAPTGSNAQNWEFIVVRDPEVKARLASQNRRAWNVYGGIGRRMARNDPKMQKVMDAVQWQADHFEEIPVLVVACLKGLRASFPPMFASSYFGSIYPSVQNLLLAARAVAHHPTLVEHLRSAADPRLSLQRHAVRGDPPGLAARSLRPHHPQARRRGGVRRPLRQPGLARQLGSDKRRSPG
jgi:nitroreductase